MNKRGDSQIDWIISLSIFLLYIAWFFVIIKPRIGVEQNQDVFSDIRKAFLEDAGWRVLEYPVLVKSGFNQSFVPIIAASPLHLNFTNSEMKNKSLFYVQNYAVFIANLTEGQNAFLITHSNETYKSYNEQLPISVSDDYTTVTDMKANFENSLPKSIEQNGLKVSDMRITIDSSELPTDNTAVYDRGSAGEYSVKSQAGNVSTIVYANSKRVDIFFFPNSERSIDLKFDADNYQNYFALGENFSLHYPSECNLVSSDSLAMFTGNQTLLFASSKNATFSFCTKNTSINFEINFTISNSTILSFIFFEGDASNTTPYKSPYNASFGFPYLISGLSLNNITYLSALNPADAAKRWGISQSFNVEVFNETSGESIGKIGSDPYDTAEVTVSESKGYLLDRHGNLEKVRVNMREWR